MAMGNMARAVLAPLVVLNFSMFAVALGFSGWMLNRFIERRAFGGIAATPFICAFGGNAATPFICAFGGNAATPFLAVFSLIAGMVGIASAITGIHHVSVGSSSSAAAGQATSWITWLLLILPFCLAWKEIHIGGTNWRQKVLEGFIIALTATKFAETLVYYLGDKSRGDTTNTPATNSTTD